MRTSITRGNAALAAALLALLAPTTPRADGPAPTPDLSVKTFPVDVSSLGMRKDDARAAGAPAGQTVGPARTDAARAARPGREGSGRDASERAARAGTRTAAIDAQVAAFEGMEDESRQSFSGRGYKLFPTTARDIQERVIFRVNVGAALDSGQLSGETFKTGFDPAVELDPNGNAFLENRQYLVGDLTLGTNGVLLPSLNSYFLSNYILDLDGGSEFAAFNNIYDNLGGREIAIHAAYAEMDGITEDKRSVLGKMRVKAGRQFRYGGARFITNFDGATVGYDDAGFDVSAFFGQRASQYIDEDPGLVGGAGVKVNGREVFNAPVDLALDYLFFDGGGNQDINGDGIDDIALARQYIELMSRIQLGDTYLYARARVVDNGELADFDIGGDDSGFGIGSLSLQVRQPIGLRLLIVGDIQQRFAREVAYDYINPVAADVINVAQQVGIGLDAPANALIVGLRANYLFTRKVEASVFARAHILEDDVVQTSYNAPYEDVGAAVSARLGKTNRLHLTGQFKLRLTQLDDDANIVDEANGIFTDFFDTSGSGVENFQEVSAEARYRGGSGDPKWTSAVGAFFRVYDLQSPYAIVEDDARAGGRVDFSYWFSRDLRLKAAAEVAQPSPTFAPELDILFSARTIMEAVF